MTVRTVYCSACDRNVSLFVEGGTGDDRPLENATDKVCLDYGDRCTGEMCPILAVPSEAVRENLARLRAKQ